MKYLLQKEPDECLDLDVYNLLMVLQKHPYQHDFRFLSLKELVNEPNDNSLYVPVGSIEFITAFLNRYHGIHDLLPIEVPMCLRQKKYLNRNYVIIDKSQIPFQGFYFIKHVSKLKSFSFVGDVKNMPPNDTLPSGLYQVSSMVDFLSEYRVMVLHDQIVAIQPYDGEPTILPDPLLLKEMVNVYSMDNDRPLAYTMDVGIIQGKGTSIIEIHPAAAFGTYGFSGSDLPYMYRLGIDYYLKINKPVMSSRLREEYKKIC